MASGVGSGRYFRRWQPKDADAAEEQVNPLSLRILTAVRVFHLGKEQRHLVDAMQANAERAYRREIIKAAQCFRNFPTTDRGFMDQLFRIVGVLNTNAFEAPCRSGGHETLLRGLFPLTAIMNHECTPNASHYFEDGRLAVVRAARDIPKGGEITTTYTKILWGNLTRNIFLKMTKHFACDCARCHDNTVSRDLYSYGDSNGRLPLECFLWNAFSLLPSLELLILIKRSFQPLSYYHAISKPYICLKTPSSTLLVCQISRAHLIFINIFTLTSFIAVIYNFP